MKVFPGSRMLLPAACTVLATAAQAQSGTACDQVKEALAARIEATGVRGYSLDVVPAGEPAPPGTKSIGTCAGGVNKVLYRRFALAPATGASATPAPTPAPPPVVAVAASKMVLPPAPPPPAPVPVAAPAPAPATAPVVVVAAASPPPPPPAPPPAEPPPVVEVKAPASSASFASLAADFALQNWQWLWLVVLLPVVGWVWQSRRSGYDEAGLPRGPKL